jgi:amidohydrolase
MKRLDIFQGLAAPIERQQELMRAAALYLYQHPELALEERLAAAYLTEKLAGAGFAVTRPIAGLETAFVAVYDSGQPGPTFALIAEYDALPGIGHGCGHNLIAASVLGAAVALAESGLLRHGQLQVIGTPAEEAVGGKIPMLAAGLFDGIEASLMLHPETYSAVAADALACTSYAFTFHGKAAHAAGNPHDGINALDGVLQTFNAINALRQRLRPDEKIHGIITKGGEATNIIPDCCEAHFNLRSATGDGLASLEGQVLACARGAAEAIGARLTITQTDACYLDMINDDAITAAIREYMTLAGFTGIIEGDPFPGSTDYGNVSQRVKSSYAFFDIGGSDAALHTAEFAQATITDAALASTARAATVLAAVAADYLA